MLVKDYEGREDLQSKPLRLSLWYASLLSDRIAKLFVAKLSLSNIPTQAHQFLTILAQVKAY
jgi:hypothetical protein